VGTQERHTTESIVGANRSSHRAFQHFRIPRAFLAGLPRRLQVLWLLNWLELEVSQGSLLAYFFNSSGRHAALAVAALQGIGAGHMAQVLTEAAALVAIHRQRGASGGPTATRSLSG
jgi:Domain of unknown function (DUF4375)